MAEKPEVQVVAVCDVETGRMQESKELVEDIEARDREEPHYRCCDMYGDFQELLARDDIDAVLIATPEHWHAIPAIAAAKAGKDIYCEKPLALTVQEGRAIVNAATGYRRVFQTGSQQRSEYSKRFVRAVELVRNKVIGDITAVDINVGGPPLSSYDLPAEPTPPTLNWDRWLGPALRRPYSFELCPINFNGWPRWRYYREYGGGALSDWGAHHFDIAQWALGMDHRGPVEVIPPNGKDIDRLVFLYANGIPVYHGGEAGCVFHGTHGTIYVDRDSLRAEPESILRTPLSPNDIRVGRDLGHREDWLACIRTRQEPIAHAEVGHRTNTVCQLANIAYELNRPLTWDPDEERFVNDEDANRLLARSMRSPWRL
jgi:predicted dehydrogenase